MPKLLCQIKALSADVCLSDEDLTVPTDITLLHLYVLAYSKEAGKK